MARGEEEEGNEGRGKDESEYILSIVKKMKGRKMSEIYEERKYMRKKGKERRIRKIN